jgi:hypothetical protein
MEAYVLETGNDVFEYRRAVQRYQESAKLQYDYTSAKGSFGLPNVLPRRPNCMDASANSIAQSGVFHNRHISRIL